jgi:alkanesulfonate monooxygenase SsuD/methylene tetrahydromethanopterin reductase-like flavin-dependent oxidoreductase (luciferase family)
VSELAQTAEASGFDSFVFEDALLYRSESATDGSWESVSIAAALAVATERIHIGQSVVNSPYREPALMAKIADTLDEISGGRYIFGIGAGNTATSDYLAFGAPTDRRYSRFAEGIEIIHSLLKTGRVDFQGEFYSARDAELVLRGPRKGGPPINIAGSGSKMLRLVARFADAWNWWTYNETLAEVTERMGPIVSELETACYETGRNPEDIDRTIDVYTIVPPGMPVPEGSDGLVSGSAEEIAGYLVGLQDLGFTEARCDLTAKTPAGVRAMANVVAMVHGG